MLKPASVRWALASLSLSMLMPSLDTSIANVGLPTLAHAFTASFQEVQWIVLAYLLAITTLIVSVGRLGDIIGRRRLLLGGICLFTAASLLCGVAPTLWLLITARAAQGLGAAVMMALTVALVGETVPKENTGSAMGLLGTMSAIGTTLGPSLGGVLIAGPGWRFIFLVNVPLGILNVLLAHRYLPVDRQEPKSDWAEFDNVGTLLIALTLGAYALAMTIGRGSFGPLNVGLLLAAMFGVGLFVIVEARGASPLIRLTTFHSSVLSASLAMSALVSTVVMATLVVGPFYLSRALGLDAAVVGIAMSAGPLVAALTGVPGGRVVDRFGAAPMTMVGLIVMSAGCITLSMIRPTLGIAGYVAPIVVVTAGYALFQGANNTAVMTDIRPDQRGVISGMLNLSRNLGFITGASVMGAVFALASASIDITTARPEAVATGMRITFAVAAILIAVALIIAVGAHRRVAVIAARRAARGFLSQPKKEDLAVLKKLIEAGTVTALVDRTYPLSEVPEAMRYLEERHPGGKIVITIDR
jgi:EmrB/QacA subfamily drug resistance transporter